MKTRHLTITRILSVVAAALLCAAGAMAQNSLPAPGSGGGYNPAPVAPAPGPGWGAGPGWGNPWGPGYMGPGGAFVNGPAWQNQGVLTVVGCGYDVYGTWRTLPLRVAYSYNGIDYDVTVLAAWNPWSDTWDTGLSTPAYNTTYYSHGNTYDFYTVLPSGTYYFNL